MDMKKEKIKLKIYLVLMVIFTILTFIGAGYVIINDGKVNAGYAVIPMVFGVVFSGLFQQTNKKIKESEK